MKTSQHKNDIHTEIWFETSQLFFYRYTNIHINVQAKTINVQKQ